MITFYPRDIGLWRDTFDFSTSSFSLVGTSKEFKDRDDLIGFCKNHGVKLDDPNYPFQILGPDQSAVLGEVFTVYQWTVLGWIKDN